MLRPLIVCAVTLIASCHRNSPSEPATMGGGGNAPTTQPATPAGPSAGNAANPATPPLTGANVILRPTGAEPVTVRVEVQRTEAERERGLMFRRSLDENAGMIFVFAQPEHQVFWMRNTFLPLDMIFISPERRVLGVVRNATPMTDDSREVPGDSLYVLEVRAGFADRHHITDGTPVELVNIPPALN